MASRAELRQMYEELDLEYTGESIEEMKDEIRKKFDEIYKPGKENSADLLSRELRKFLTKEYDYVIVDREGNELEWDYM